MTFVLGEKWLTQKNCKYFRNWRHQWNLEDITLNKNDFLNLWMSSIWTIQNYQRNVYCVTRISKPIKHAVCLGNDASQLIVRTERKAASDVSYIPWRRDPRTRNKWNMIIWEKLRFRMMLTNPKPDDVKNTLAWAWARRNPWPNPWENPALIYSLKPNTKKRIQKHDLKMV